LAWHVATGGDCLGLMTDHELSLIADRQSGRPGTSMTYSATTIAGTVAALNTTLFLPAIQRPFIWEEEQVVQLFDSLMKGYPISSFLFWKIAPENNGQWQIYQFAENFRYGDVHTDPVGVEGRDITLVLDGQQRLTSMLIGLRGSFTVKAKGKRWDNPSAWLTKRLYIDLLVDPDQMSADEDTEEEIEHSFGFRLFETPPSSGPAALWVKVGQILDQKSYQQFLGFRDQIVSKMPAAANWVARQTAVRNLDRLYATIWQDEIISSFTEFTQDYDRVLGIFVRANDGGTKLSKSDLMMAVLSSKWSDISAKEEIYNLVDTINTRLDRKNDISKDFVMKACLVLSDLDHVYKVKNFTNKNLEIMRENWPRIRTSLVRTFRLINRLGIDRDTLTSANALLPIAHYLHVNDIDLLAASTPFNVQNAGRVRQWLISALLLAVFGGRSDGTISAARAAITEGKKISGEFPLDLLNQHISRQIKRPSYFTDDTLGRVFDFRYGQGQTFLLLSLIYDEQNWGSIPHHVDHVFPRARVSRDALMAGGVTTVQIDSILAALNRPGNLELLTATENLEKTDSRFEDWIRTRDVDFIARHLIPDDESLWSLLMLPKFVAERERLIRLRLTSLRSSVPNEFEGAPR
jgi:hypothetical protein